MASWRNNPQRGATEVLASALPQMAIDLPLNALQVQDMRIRLMGEAKSDDPTLALGDEEIRYRDLRAQVQARLVQETAHTTHGAGPALRERLAEILNQTAMDQGQPLDLADGIRLTTRIQHDLLGFGPLEQLLSDPSITEIMVNGPSQIWIEREGRLSMSAVKFETDDQLRQVIDHMVSRVGRHIDESSPMVDARLEDGSRIHAVIPPASLSGPSLTIRRFTHAGMEADALVSNGTASQAMMGFLRAAVRARLNIVVSGGTGAGKTTTLNALSAFIQDGERIITIEDAAELKLRQLHVLSLETRPANVEGRGQISVRDLVISALRMRPDRLVVGECRGAEAMDMLQAMSTGHDGSLTTLHASSAKEAITRLETMVLWAGTDLPMRAIRSQVVNAIDLVVQQNRLRDGSRRIVSISEVSGLEDGEVVLHDLFRFDQQGMDDEGRVIGAHSACARIPSRAKDIVAAGESIDPLSFLTTSGGLTAMQEHRRRLHDWIPDAPAAAPLLLHGERRRPELSVVGRRSLRRIAQPA